MTLEEAKKFFADDKFATETTGIEIEAVAPNYAKCSLKLDRRHYNAAGQVMGGVAYTLADFVFAVATNACRGSLTVTSVSQISYLSACRGSVLTGESELLKDGKRSCFFRINITDELGTPVAVVNTSGIHLEGKTAYGFDKRSAQ